MPIIAKSIQQIQQKKSEKKPLQQVSSRITANNVRTTRQDKKIKRENKPNITSEIKVQDKKIRSEDKGTKSVESIKINRPSQSSQVKAREILKPSRYVLDLMK
jgi:hypothetical protein